MAVLPTPGSPTRITFDLLRRPRASATFSNSSMRPITGSILFFLTASLRFVVNDLNALSACPVCGSSSPASATSELR